MLDSILIEANKLLTALIKKRVINSIALFLFLCKMKHKSGFVSIIGYPNAGKSTLVNALVGEKLSIVNAKVQTTRDRILGIYNSENYQIVFSR